MLRIEACGIRLCHSERRRLLPWRWLLPWLVTLLLLGLGILLAADRQEPTLAWFLADVPGAREVGWETLSEANTQALANLLALKEPIRGSLPRVGLIAGDDTLHQMLVASYRGDPELRRQQGGDRPEFRAYYVDESDRPARCRISMRGVGHWHRNVTKPSFRVRLRRSEVHSGRRELDLSRPEDPLALSNWLPASLAREIGLLSEEIDPVLFYYNGHYLGVYCRGTRPGEELAVRQERMPGTFYKGDSLGVERAAELWRDAEIWKLSGEQDPEQVQVLRDFLAAVQTPPSPESLRRLSDCLDGEAYARWNALMIVVGSGHTDIGHNHLYYLDGSRGKLEPVLWDPNGFGTNQEVPETPVDLLMNPIQDRLTRDPRWVHRRNQWIWRLLEQQANPQKVKARIGDWVKRLRPALEADPALSGLVTTPVYEIPRLRFYPVTAIDRLEGRVLEWYRRRREFLLAYLGEARFYREGDRLISFGTVAVRVVFPDGRELVAYPGLSEPKYLVGKPGPRSSQALEYVVPTPRGYTLPKGEGGVRYFNAISGVEVRPSAPAGGGPPTRTLELPEPGEPRPVVLGPGTVRLDRDLRAGRLRIEPGTRLLLAPGVDILVEGELTARGRPGAPILLGPSHDRPWGALTLAGLRSKGVMENVQVEGGSVTHQPGFARRGAVNVLSCPDFVAADCRFGANHLGDDNVNAVESTVLFRDCEWNGALSDSLDLDRCRGRIQGCRFYDSGNDGLDFSTGQIEVVDCQFRGSGDKGASVGERTRATFLNCSFEDCRIGLEVKDDSEVTARSCRFLADATGVNAYRKKALFLWGGRANLVDCRFEGCREPLRADSLSQLRVLGSQPGAVSGAAGSVLRLPRWSAAWLP